MSTSTDLPRPTTHVQVEPAAEREATTPSLAPAAPVVHDDDCAIHDEHGTCTCGAAQVAANARDDE